MACKTCSDERIDKQFDCHSCKIKKGDFKWLVITRAGDFDGNHYDEIITLDRRIEIVTGRGGARKLPSDGQGFLSYKKEVFQVGDIYPMEPDFEREVVGAGRKASKWDVEYQLFDSKDYKKAILFAIKVRDEANHVKTNLEIVEEGYVANENLKKVQASKDPLKLIYRWIQHGRITLNESKVLLGEVFKNEKGTKQA